MENSDLIEIIEAKAELFDARREVYVEPSVRVFLLKRSTDLKSWTVEMEITEGWWVEHREFRGQYLLQYATTADGFGKRLKAVSDFSIDGAVHQIDPNQRDLDLIRPSGKKPYWKIYGRATGEKFTPPA